MTPRMLGRRNLIVSAAAGLAALGTAGPARAGGLASPASKPILTVSGKISQTNDGKVARFDRALLESLGDDKFTTSTPWHDKAMEFEGVRMTRLMQAVGATGDRVRVVALDDFAADLPIADFATYGTLLALKINGHYMAVSEKGPSFIIYPFDQNPELQKALYYTRSVWSVASIAVL